MIETWGLATMEMSPDKAAPVGCGRGMHSPSHAGVVRRQPLIPGEASPAPVRRANRGEGSCAAGEEEEEDRSPGQMVGPGLG